MLLRGYSGAQNKGNNCCFPYKIPIVARVVENYLNVMLNSQFFSVRALVSGCSTEHLDFEEPEMEHLKLEAENRSVLMIFV